MSSGGFKTGSYVVLELTRKEYRKLMIFLDSELFFIIRSKYFEIHCLGKN